MGTKMNLENFLEGEQLLTKLKDVKKIFFYRICGTGMGAAACLLKEAGYDISGADITFSPPMSTYLDSTGVNCLKLDSITDEELKRYDLIIVGNSVPKTSEYASQIERCGVKFTSFPEIIGKAILADKHVIGIAGTHGKTTTTYFMTQLLQSLGEKPGYLIGGILDDAPPAKLGDKYFVIESDEYDSSYFQKIAKFRLYEINSMILTSLEFDHADIYNCVEDIEEEFVEAFKGNIEEVIADGSYPSIQKLSKKYSDLGWNLYANSNGPEILSESSKATIFSVQINNSPVEFTTNIIGLHNILNLTGCILFLHGQGFEVTKIQDAIRELELVKRRQEVRGVYKGSIVIDDFAHHPRAVKMTIDAIKTKYSERKIITVFEPISATARSSIFQDEFTQSLSLSDKVIIAQNPLQTTVKDGSNLDCDKMVTDLGAQGIESTCCRDLESLQGKIDELSGDQSVILVLSNRTCLGLWESKFINELS